MFLRSFIKLKSSLWTFSQLRTIGDALSQSPQANIFNPSALQRVPRSKVEFLAKMLFMPSQSPPDSRLLKIAVVGFPNVGKSSLVNMLTNWRVCAVSGKAHTTRSKQAVVFMKDNIQLVFVDLPGLVSSRQARQFKLERTFIRDPHAAIFDADLILVVVDASNKYSREALDPEVLKTLHFFSTKESVLVLNKIDKSKGNPTRLLEVTRRLTAGVVGGRTSHLDAFANKFNQRALLASNEAFLKHRPTIEAIIYPRLPAEAHEAAEKRLSEIQRLLAALPPPIQIDSGPRLPPPPPPPPPPTPPPTLLLREAQPELEQTTASIPQSEPTNKVEAPDLNRTAVKQSSPDKCDLTEHSAVNTSCDETSGGRLVTAVEHQSIEEFFNTFKPSALARATSVSLEGSSRDGDAVGDDDPYLESILDRIKEQLMLKSATKEEVAVRRQQWRELAIKLQGVKHWEGFSQVFMVSSATGEGIDNLRNYLLERAKPGKQWLLSPALITDQEPSELIRMCVWAHCLDLLPQEVPYGLVITVDECERVRLASEGDDRIYVHARIRCPNERSIKKVIGPGGSTIRSIASAAKQELSNMFQAPTVVKLTAEAVRPSQKSMRRMRAAKDFAEVFPNFGEETRSPGVEVAEA